MVWHASAGQESDGRAGIAADPAVPLTRRY
jgi:hypothetical protein